MVAPVQTVIFKESLHTAKELQNKLAYGIAHGQRTPSHPDSTLFLSSLRILLYLLNPSEKVMGSRPLLALKRAQVTLYCPSQGKASRPLESFLSQKALTEHYEHQSGAAHSFEPTSRFLWQFRSDRVL